MAWACASVCHAKEKGNNRKRNSLVKSERVFIPFHFLLSRLLMLDYEETERENEWVAMIAMNWPYGQKLQNYHPLFFIVHLSLLSCREKKRLDFVEPHLAWPHAFYLYIFSNFCIFCYSPTILFKYSAERSSSRFRRNIIFLGVECSELVWNNIKIIHTFAPFSPQKKPESAHTLHPQMPSSSNTSLLGSHYGLSLLFDVQNSCVKSHTFENKEEHGKQKCNSHIIQCVLSCFKNYANKLTLFVRDTTTATILISCVVGKQPNWPNKLIKQKKKKSVFLPMYRRITKNGKILICSFSLRSTHKTCCKAHFFCFKNHYSNIFWWMNICGDIHCSEHTQSRTNDTYIIQ